LTLVEEWHLFTDLEVGSNSTDMEMLDAELAPRIKALF